MPDHEPASLQPETTALVTHDQQQTLLTVVGIGASAGGLDACTKLVQGLPDGNGMTFILVQHLDPNHDSLLVPLLAKHTAMPVMQAVEGMSIERDHLYIIPPDTYLSVAGGMLHLATPTARRGRRLPFDFLLNSLADAYGRRTVCIVLSGTGADGSLGLVAIKERGGLVIVQDPAEAEYDGMPRSAIATGAVDLVLAAKDMPDALALHPYPATAPPLGEAKADPEQRSFAAIIDLLRATTPHDFSLYKPGTLHRRIERRMSMVGTTDLGRYLGVLRADPAEAARLSSDLLINVTSFFRDPKVFERLAADIVPDLIDRHDAGQPLRVWIAGCSTGEEAWSLAMLFREQVTARKASIKLQIFASDIDADAVATARIGSYPETIAAEVSPARLARFFSHDEQGFHVLPELRSLVVFSVHDLLTDPPFSRLDFISCRNLLIYLRRETQARVLSLLDFGLHQGGILLLGAAETHGKSEARFKTIGKAERIYRRVGRGRPTGLQFPVTAAGRSTAGQPQAAAVSSQATLRALSQRLLLETYAPAAILINSRRECLYALGPVDRYLRVAAGTATQDVLILARDGVRTKLRSALRRASQGDPAPPAKPAVHDATAAPFNIEVRAVNGPGEATHMVCFVEQPAREVADKDRLRTEHQAGDLKEELAALREELAETLRSVETSGEEQRALNEDALSVNEEYQSTNEELLTSKEELQSLNEELTALNSQLQETLERQRTTSNDMQNVLNSTDVATLFLDRELNIRFFTPATRSLFKVIPGDIGRPLADLVSLAADTALLADAQAVLQDLVPVEREIEAGDVWFMRRVLPYRTEDSGVEGVVITFTNVTDRKRAARALEAAKQEAERANVTKSRFLAAASHDLRQPLQTLALLQGLLATAVRGEAAEQLVIRLDETLSAMAGMLNTVLDLNQIEAGVVKADVVRFPIAGMLDRLRDEFQYQAEAQGLAWTVMPCSLSVRSDPALLEQMVRNLLSNAMKYTREGKILLGCRRRGESLAIEVWDSGTGIPDDKLDTIFEEYSQLDNAARDRAKGLGLGLSIVQRLADLLGHTVMVRSRLDAGSVFAITVALGRTGATPPSNGPEAVPVALPAAPFRTGAILVVEDDPAVSELLRLFLAAEGHQVATVADGEAALELVERRHFVPELLLSDYNLPGQLNGLQVAGRLRQSREAPLAVVILTGDVSAEALVEVAHSECVPLNKPVKLTALTAVLQRLLPKASPVAIVQPSQAATTTVEPGPQTVFIPGRPTVFIPGRSTVFVIDDDPTIRAGLRDMLRAEGRHVEDYPSAEAFLGAYRPGLDACLLIDATLPGLGGLDLLRKLRSAEDQVAVIIITGHGDVHMAVEAMRAGASDFIEKPVMRADLLVSLERALDQSSDSGRLASWRTTAAHAVDSLTNRQREVMSLVLAGLASKNIASDLGISRRTVENHRAAIMEKTGSSSLPALARLALAAAWTGSDGSLLAAGPPKIANPPFEETRGAAGPERPATSPSAGVSRRA